jgi:hypothetical protein
MNRQAVGVEGRASRSRFLRTVRESSHRFLLDLPNKIGLSKSGNADWRIEYVEIGVSRRIEQVLVWQW